jgi:hypothetical protein
MNPITNFLTQSNVSNTSFRELLTAWAEKDENKEYTSSEQEKMSTVFFGIILQKEYKGLNQRDIDHLNQIGAKLSKQKDKNPELLNRITIIGREWYSIASNKTLNQAKL